jgi:hypothetical protein
MGCWTRFGSKHEPFTQAGVDQRALLSLPVLERSPGGYLARRGGPRREFQKSSCGRPGNLTGSSDFYFDHAHVGRIRYAALGTISAYASAAPIFQSGQGVNRIVYH